MTRFAYKAIPTGRGGAGVIDGALDAPDEGALRERLRGQGLIPIEIKVVGGMAGLRQSLTRSGLRRADAAWFFRTLHMLLAGKAPIESALSTMHELAPRDRVREACGQVRESLRSGESLADAVEKTPGLADRHHLALLRVGHESGRLEHTVALIERSIDTREHIRRTVTGRLVYPAILVVVAIIAVWLLASFVIPRFAETLADVGATLPLSTRITLAASKWLIWIMPLLLIGGAALASLRSISLPPVWRARIDRLSLRAPIVGSLIWHGQGAVLTDTLATMIEGGGDVLDGLEQSARALKSTTLRDRLNAARGRVREGDDLGKALTDLEVVPPIAAAVVQIGIRSGDLVGALRRASRVCLEKQEELTGRLLTLMEPAVILILAGVVGWVIYSLIAGILTVNDLGAL